MSERDKMLSEFRQGIGGIDPVLQQAEDYGRGMKAVGKVVKSQGQVMSATLDNNARLWEERKQLKADRLDAIAERDSARARLKIVERERDEAREAFEKLSAAGGDTWKALYDQAKKTLTSYLYDQLDNEQLAEKLEAMKAQQAELEADGVPKVPLPSAEAVAEHIEREGVEL